MSDVEQEHPATAHIGPLTDAGRSTWQAIAELVDVVSDGSWAIVGGQMVAIHAALAGVDPPRVTDDGDVVVDVRTFGRRAMRKVAESLVAADFTTSASPEGVTRFVRGQAKIDLLAPEGIGGNATTIPPGYAVQAPGTSQALGRTAAVTVDWGAGRATVRCPSLLGAMVAKAAGSREIVALTADERLKHQRDLVFLLSLAATRPVEELDLMSDAMTKTDRRRLAAAISPILDDSTHRARSPAANIDDVVDVVALLLDGRVL